MVGGRWSGQLNQVRPQEHKGTTFTRESFRELGYEDDAMIVDTEIYHGLLKEYEGAAQSDFHADYEYDEVSSDVIGKKWVVVVDYHY